MPDVDHHTRLEFGHALAQWGADRAGARLLHIKGLPAHLVLPVGDLSSSDVDILVDPLCHAGTVTSLLASSTVKVNSDGTLCAEGHAVEVVSDGLNVALDVHAFLPGCREPASLVFEELWSGSSEVRIGGWACRVPDRVGTAFVSVVHAARNRVDSKAYTRALSHWEALSEDEKNGFDGMVRRLAAEAAAHVVLGGYDDANRWEAVKLRAYQTQARPATLWLATFLAQPTLGGRLGVLRRAARSRVRTVPTDTSHYRDVGGRWARTVRAVGSLRPSLREAVELFRSSNG